MRMLDFSTERFSLTNLISAAIATCVLITTIQFSPQGAFALDTRFDDSDSRICYTAEWSAQTDQGCYGDSMSVVDSASAAGFVFTGTSVDLIATTGSSQGIANVSVDGGTPDMVDLYTAATEYQTAVWSRSGLSETTHTVVIEYTGSKNASSSATDINIDAVETNGELVTDITPPITTSDVKEGYVATADIELSATDDLLLGEPPTWWRLDGGSWTSGTSVEATGTGEHWLEYYSVDIAGNEEDVHTASFYVVPQVPIKTTYQTLRPYTNTTLTAANGPYEIKSLLEVPVGVTLTIQPGTVVKLAQGVEMRIRGTLVGTDGAVFASSYDDMAQGSKDLVYSGGHTPIPWGTYSAPRAVIYSGAVVSGLSFIGFGYVGITGATVSNCTFARNAYGAAVTYSTVSQCLFAENLGVGVKAGSGSVFTECRFLRNGSTGMSYSSQPVTAVDCEFSDNAWASVQSHVFGGQFYGCSFDDWVKNGDDPDDWFCVYSDYGEDARLELDSGQMQDTEANARSTTGIDDANPRTFPADSPAGTEYPPVEGDPINTATGAYLSTHRDISVPGKGPELSFSRSYDSLDVGLDSGLGAGWSHSFAINVSEGRDDVTVTYPDGMRKAFEPTGGGVFESPHGVTEVLTQSQTGLYVLTFLDGTTWQFNDGGQIVRIEDRYGNGVDLAYAAFANGSMVATATADDGRYIALDRDASGHIMGVADQAGRHVDYEYDAVNGTAVPRPVLSSVVDIAGETWSYTYDPTGQLLTQSSPERPATPFLSNTYGSSPLNSNYAWAQPTIYRWDEPQSSLDLSDIYVDAEDVPNAPQTAVVEQTDGKGASTSLAYGTYSGAGGVTSITDGRGHTGEQSFDEERRQTSEEDPLGHVWARDYTAAGLPESFTNPLGDTTTIGYDGAGNVTSVTDAEDHEVTASYDSTNNNLLWSDDAAGHRTTYSYDASGTALTAVATPVATTHFDHYADGSIHHIRSAGATATLEYTPQGWLSRLVDPLGFSTTLSYDAAGNLTAASDAESRTATFDYDDAGHILSVTDPTSATVSFSYDANGNRETVTDARDNTTTFAYDAMDLLAGVTDARGGTWGYTYDENYNLSMVVNSRDETRTYVYDAADRLTDIEDALGNHTELTYDAAGNLLSTDYASGGSVERRYLRDGLLSTWALPAEETTWSFTYEPTRWLSSALDQDGVGYSYGYNAVGWLTGTTDTVNPAVTGGLQTRYAYDEAGRTTGIKLSAEETRTYAYNLRGDLTSLELDSDPIGVHSSYEYDRTGLVTSMELPEGTQIAYGYDAAGRVESIAATTGASESIAVDYERDASGAITRANDTRYGYDEIDRLVSWYDPSTDATTTYSYDANYNLTAVSVDGSLTTGFTFDAADRIVNEGFDYDDAGNMTTDGERDYLYDSANRLVEIRESGEATAVARYGYDAANRRLWTEENGETTFFHYDGASANVIAETGEDGQLVASYVYDDRGRLHSMTRDAETYYYITDAHGDVVALTDEAGAVVNEYSYDPYGNPIHTEEGVDNPYRYAGYRFDEATGLYYCWNRYYDPGTYRFITADLYPGELGSPATMNAYVYCVGNPMSWIDPTGLVTGGVGAQASGAFGPGFTASLVVVPDKGSVLGRRILVSGGWGVGFGWGAGFFGQMTFAKTIAELNGSALDIQGAMGNVEVDALIGFEDACPENDEKPRAIWLGFQGGRSWGSILSGGVYLPRTYDVTDYYLRARSFLFNPRLYYVPFEPPPWE